MALTRRLLDGLKERKCELFTPSEDQLRLGIVSFRHPTEPTDSLFARLKAERFVVAQRRGWIRVSHHVYNTEEQIDAFLEALNVR